MLDRLMKELRPQLTPEVEVKFNLDNGGRSIGTMRNELVQAAKGDYVAFIDDDDSISPDYVSLVLSALETDPDCCSLNGLLFERGDRRTSFRHSIDYVWEFVGGVYYRSPNHLNAIKRDLVLQTGFLEINHGEDSDFSHRIKSLLKTESKIDETIYYYMKD